MKRWQRGIAVVCFFGACIDANASGLMIGGFGGGSATPATPTIGSGGGMGMVGGVGGLGMGGGMIGTPGFYFNGGLGMGCYPYPGGCCGGMGHFSGFCPYPYFPIFPANSTQFYSKWQPSPSKSYYYRVLQIQTPAPTERSFEFVLVHYPDRPKMFYFFDPVEKTYLGRFKLRSSTEKCFELLSASDRNASLNEIKETAYRPIGGMPSLAHFITPKSGVLAAELNGLRNVKILRPPESVPDELLGLPAEEGSPKKK